MKKPDMKRLLLILFAVVAVFFACTPNAVTVFIQPEEGAEAVAPVYCSFFTLIEDVRGAISLPVAALCACINLLLAGIYVVIGKKGLAVSMKWLSLAAAIISCVLILARTEGYVIVPNLLVPVALMCEFVLCTYLTKEPKQEDKKPIRIRK